MREKDRKRFMAEMYVEFVELADLAYLESQVDFRQFTMTANEYAAALAMDSYTIPSTTSYSNSLQGV